MGRSITVTPKSGGFSYLENMTLTVGGRPIYDPNVHHVFGRLTRIHSTSHQNNNMDLRCPRWMLAKSPTCQCPRSARLPGGRQRPILGPGVQHTSSANGVNTLTDHELYVKTFAIRVLLHAHDLPGLFKALGVGR